MLKLDEFDKIIKEMRDTFVKKNHDYGDDNILRFGSKGVFIRQWDKMCRLEQLIWNEKDPKVTESVEDTLKDLANYCIISLIVLKNKWK